MNKNQIVMSAIGGVAGLAALGFGALVYFQADEREQIEADLQGLVARCNAAADAQEGTVKSHRDNEKALKEWADGAFAYVEAMDKSKSDPNQAPAAFKRQMFVSAQELMKLPAESEAKIIKDTFDFGERFKAYVAGDDIPPESELPALQRQWDDVMRITDILLREGAAELTGVEVVAKPAPPVQNTRGAKKKQAKILYPSREETYKITFRSMQEPLVKILNSIATDDRFMSVDSLKFEQAGDPLAQMIGGGDREKNERGGKKRRNRGRASVEEEQDGEEDEVARKGLVTNPETCEPFTVEMVVTTFDFAESEEERK